jgi:putative heme-binding domain-containing protein
LASALPAAGAGVADTSDAFRGLGRLAGERALAVEISTTLELAAPLEERAPGLGSSLLGGLAGGLEQAVERGRSLPPVVSLDTPSLGSLRDRENDALALPAWRVSMLLGWEPPQQELDRARNAAARAADASRALPERIAALGWLEAIGDDALAEHRVLLLDLLDGRVASELQQAALDRLVRSTDPEVGRQLIARWRTLGPAVRQRAADFLVYRPFNHDALLDALESGGLEIGQLNLHLERRRALLRARDPETRRRAAAFLSDLEVLTRADAVAAMRPALALAGEADRGREVFRELCARCHRIREAESGPDAVLGMEVGPSLTDIFRRSRESLLVDIVDPNAAVDPSYLVFDVTTRGGETASGLLLAQDERGVTVRTAEGADVRIAVEQIDEISASGLSLMPEELESGLDVTRMADLLAFLSQPR